MTVSENVGSVRVCTQLSGPADFIIDTQIRALSGTATAGTDFTTEAVIVSFPAQTTEQRCADFTINDDLVLENSEKFTVEFSILSSNAMVVTGVNETLTITIIDNDCEADSLFCGALIYLIISL